MIIREQQNENVYNSVFDFIFEVQKRKINKPFPKDREEIGSYGSALIEIGTQPLLFPIESAFGSINDYIGKTASIQTGAGMRASLLSGDLLNPYATSKKNILRNRARRNWASIGGHLHSSIDGALLSLYAKRFGASSEVAYQTGKLFEKTLKEVEKQENKDKELFGYQSKEEAERDLIKNSIKLKALSVGNKYGDLFESPPPQEGKDTEVKEEKKPRKKDYDSDAKDEDSVLKKDRDVNIDTEESENQKIETKKRISPLINSEKIHANNRKKVFVKKLEKHILLSQTINSKEERIRSTSLHLKEEGIDIREAYKTAEDIWGKIGEEIDEGMFLSKSNNGFKIAERTAYSALSEDVTQHLVKEGKHAEIVDTREKIKDLVDPLKKETLGMKSKRAVMLTNWLSDSGAWTDNFLKGDWEKLQSDDPNLPQLVKRETVKISNNGKEEELSYVKGADTVIGKALGTYYYLHPNNLIKGLFLNGELWLKWAPKVDGKVDSKSFAFLMYQTRVGKLFEYMAKPFQAVSEKVLHYINPVVEGIKNLTKKALSTVLGATGIGLLMVNFIMNKISDKLGHIVNQLVMVVIITIIGILFLLLESIGIFYSDDKIKSVTQTSEGVTNEEIFPEDYFLETENYNLD